MPVMLKDNEVSQASVHSSAVPLSLSKNGAMSANNTLLKRYSSVLLKDVTDTTYPIKRKLDPNATSKTAKKIHTDTTMLNGYRASDNDTSHTDHLPVATLSNMGNTCYLNSILYTLRFAPSFLHNLHHLVADLSLMHSKLNQTKIKSSSLGRNIGNLTGSSSRSSSNKDLLSFGNSQNELHPKSKMQIATEKLHELYMSLHNLEMKDNNDCYQPASFLQALIDVNSIYQGHQQQDAHELLVYLLDILRETCNLLATQAENEPALNEPFLENPPINSSNTSKSWSVRRSWKKHKDTPPKKMEKSSKDKPQIKEDEHSNGILPNENATTNENQTPAEGLRKKVGFNFVSEDFGGITLRRTKCLECESVTERKEPFYDICVPITNQEADLDEKTFYRSSCVTTENLRDTNKYWCEQCIRYNEARREVSYERLPNLLVLQLKRFSTTAAGTEKLNNYIPTPLVLECFCDQCSDSAAKQHSYQLYGVIMHLGSTMASGHYIAYTRASDHHCEYLDCCRHSKTVTFPSSTADRSLNLLKFLKPKSHNGGSDGIKTANSLNSKNGTTNGVTSCKSMDCCGIRLNKSTIENVLNTIDGKHNDDGQLWLECDDDVVRTLTTKDFQKMLNCKRNLPATPYLLFYSKILENSSVTSDDQ